MGLREAKFGRTPVHPSGKCGKGTVYAMAAAFAASFPETESMPGQFMQGQPVSGAQAHGGTLRPDHLLRDGDFPIRLLQREKGRHNLCRAGHGARLLRIFGKEHTPVLRFHQYGRSRGDGRLIRRPGRNGIGCQTNNYPHDKTDQSFPHDRSPARNHSYAAD